MKLKRLLSVVLAFGTALSLSVSSFALFESNALSKHVLADPANAIYSEVDGVPCLGTFNTSSLGATERAFMVEWVTSPSRVLYADGSTLYFCIYPTDTKFTCSSNGDNYQYVLRSNKGFRYLKSSRSDFGGSKVVSPSSNKVDNVIFWGGTQWHDVVVGPLLVEAYHNNAIANYTDVSGFFRYAVPELILKDDSGIFPQPVTTHSLTINYQYEDGTSAADPHTEAFAKDAPYSVASPAIAGFTASPATVSGTMPDSDVTITVTYTETPPVLVEHTLTIDYVYEGGGQASDSVSQVYLTGAPYLVSSPNISGYTADVKSVAGIMPDNDLTITVIYTPVSSSGGSSSGGSGGGGDGGWDYGNPFLKPSSFPSFDFSNPFTKPSSLPSFSFSNPFVNPYR